MTAAYGVTKWVRWSARGIGSLVAGWWVLVGAAHAIAGTDPWTWESAVLTALIVSSAVGVLIAWMREGIGGLVVTFCGAAHSIFAYVVAGHNKGVAMMLAGIPLLIAGILFLVSWKRQTGRE